MNALLIRLTPCLLLPLALIVGCSKAPPPPPEPEAEPEEVTEFSFTDTSKTVSAEELQGVQKQATAQAGSGSQNLSVKADFNRDGLEDLALVESTGEEGSEITVYIQKPGEANGDKVFYYRGGTIPCPGSCDIKGIMERRGKEFTDLVVLAAGASGANDIVLYRNNGRKFIRQED